MTANDVVDTLIAAMNVTGGEAALYERLKGSDALIILDNCEHVVEAAAALAVRLLDAAPGMRILCTSQAPLDIDGEALFELTPLALEDAAELFTRRATAQRKSQRLVEDREAVLELCRSLDGLPLAIELAAARTKTLSIEEITRRLDDRFNVLNDPTSRRPERRRALRATIRWSYELLFPDDQRGLWALATFAGGAPLAAVESVLEALDVPARGGDRCRRSTGQPFVGDRRRRRCVAACSLPTARQRPRVRSRGDGRCRHDRHRACRARRMVRSSSRILHAGCSERSPSRTPRLRPRRARQHRRRLGLEHGP